MEPFAWGKLSIKGIGRAVLEWPKMFTLMSYPPPIRQTEVCLFRPGKRMGLDDLPRIKAHAGVAGGQGVPLVRCQRILGQNNHTIRLPFPLVINSWGL